MANFLMCNPVSIISPHTTPIILPQWLVNHFCILMRLNDKEVSFMESKTFYSWCFSRYSFGMIRLYLIKALFWTLISPKKFSMRLQTLQYRWWRFAQIFIFQHLFWIVDEHIRSVIQLHQHNFIPLFFSSCTPCKVELFRWDKITCAKLCSQLMSSHVRKISFQRRICWDICDVGMVIFHLFPLYFPYIWILIHYFTDSFSHPSPLVSWSWQSHSPQGRLQACSVLFLFVAYFFLIFGDISVEI